MTGKPRLVSSGKPPSRGSLDHSAAAEAIEGRKARCPAGAPPYLALRALPPVPSSPEGR